MPERRDKYEIGTQTDGSLHPHPHWTGLDI